MIATLVIVVCVLFLFGWWGDHILRNAGWKFSSQKWKVNRKRFPGIRFIAVACTLVVYGLAIWSILCAILHLCAFIVDRLAPFIALGATILWVRGKFQ